MTSVLGMKDAREIQRGVERYASTHRPNLAVVPAEIANTSSETLPYFKRVDLLQPVQPRPQVGIDTYFGDYASTSPDVFVLPKDDRVICEMGPGRAVFLSDGVTHHYAIVDWVDYTRRIVTLVDAWAPVSFMLPGHNAAGVSARAYVGNAGQPLLDLSFDDFMTVLHGSLEMLAPRQYFETLEQLYPALANREDYLFWKYSRLMTSGGFDTDFMTALEMTARTDVSAFPKLQLLRDFANDEVIGVPSGFTVPEAGRAAKPDQIPALRAAFLGRLKDYATTLPWALKWRLLDRAKLNDDVDLRTRIVDAYLAEDPHDVDFQIVRAEMLLRHGKPDVALTELASAGEQWKADVLSSIKAPPDKAMAYFFARDYGTETFSVLQWRYARIRLLTMIARLAAGVPVDDEREIEDLLDKYKAGALLVDFFGYLIELAWRANHAGDELAEIDGVIPLAAGDPVRTHIAEALYNQFVVLQPISTLPPGLRSKLRASPVGAALCDISASGRIVEGAIEQNQLGLRDYCGPPRSHSQ